MSIGSTFALLDMDPSDVRVAERRLVQGNEAICEGGIAAGIRYYAGYPITPCTEIAEYMAMRQPQVGGVYLQMEDEIGSIHSVIGASLTGAKAMTATAVARLVESRRLRWDTTLAEALPELEPGMHAQFRRATVRQLLDHRAGLPADTALIAPHARGIDRSVKSGVSPWTDVSPESSTEPSTATLSNVVCFVMTW